MVQKGGSGSFNGQIVKLKDQDNFKIDASAHLNTTPMVELVSDTKTPSSTLLSSTLTSTTNADDLYAVKGTAISSGILNPFMGVFGIAGYVEGSAADVASTKCIPLVGGVTTNGGVGGVSGCFIDMAALTPGSTVMNVTGSIAAFESTITSTAASSSLRGISLTVESNTVPDVGIFGSEIDLKINVAGVGSSTIYNGTSSGSQPVDNFAKPSGTFTNLINATGASLTTGIDLTSSGVTDALKAGGGDISEATNINATEVAVNTIGTAGQTTFFGDGSNLTNIVVKTESAFNTYNASDVISPSDTSIMVTGAGGLPVTLTSAPTVSAGTAGQEITLIGTGDATALTLQSDNNLPGSNLLLSGGQNFTLGLGDT